MWRSNCQVTDTVADQKTKYFFKYISKTICIQACKTILTSKIQFFQISNVTVVLVYFSVLSLTQISATVAQITWNNYIKIPDCPFPITTTFIRQDNVDVKMYISHCS